MPATPEIVTVEMTVKLDAGLLPLAPEEPLPTPDLLSRLSGSLVLPETDRKEVDGQLNWFAKHPSYMKRVFVRSERYIWYIMDELERRDMPADIALLPIVESALRPVRLLPRAAPPGCGRSFRAPDADSGPSRTGGTTDAGHHRLDPRGSGLSRVPAPRI